MTFTENFQTLVSAPVWESLQATSEAREYPRIALEIPVAFRNSAGQHCAARLRNISADGLQVHCTMATARVIHPRGGRLQPDTQPLLHATAVLPLASGAETLSIGVRLVYSAAFDEDPCCVLGFQFLSLRPKARRLVEAFVTEHQQLHAYAATLPQARTENRRSTG